MAKKLQVTNGLIIAEYNSKEQKELGYLYGVFTKDEWDQGQDFRYSEMDCDSLKEAYEFCKSY